MKQLQMWHRAAVVAILLIPTAGAMAQQKDSDKQSPPTLSDKDRELLKELEFIDESDVKDETVKTGLEELLETVVVTATKRKQTIAAAPAIISVVTASQIKAMGHRSVGEALRSLPGFYLLSDHVEWNAGIRGVNGGQRAGSRMMKVLIDGQPTSFRPNTSNWLGEELIPIEAVSRIEVIRGPTSALYGANAFLGVVNIITKSGALVDGALVSGRFSFVGKKPGGGGTVVLGKKTGNVELLLAASGSFLDRSGLEIGNMPNTQNYFGVVKSKEDTSTPTSLFMKLFYQSPMLGGISLDVAYQRLHAHGAFQDWGPLVRASEIYRAKVGAEDPLDFPHNLISLEQIYIRSRLSRTFLDSFSVAVSAAVATMGPTADDHLALDGTGVDDYFTRDFGTTGVDLVGELTYTLKDVNSFTVGTDFTLDWHNLLTYWGHDVYDPSNPTQTVVPTIAPNDDRAVGERRFHNFGAYFQSVLYPFQLFGASYLTSLGLTLGLRYDRHNIYGDAVNYRAGMVWQWRKLSAKVLYGTSFKAPASVQLFTNKLVSVVGNENLKPEKAQTVEVQLGGELFAGFNGTVTWFYSLIDDKVEIRPSQIVVAEDQAQNVADIKGTGVEADLAYVWRGLTAYANLSFQKNTVEEEPPLGAKITRNTSLYPSLMTKFGVAYKESRIYLGASVEGRYISSVLASSRNAQQNDPINPNDPYSIDGYVSLDVSLFSVGLKFFRERETFGQLRVSNLTGAKFFYPGFRDFDIPALGRTFMLTLSQQL